MGRRKGKVAIVRGGARGQGRAHAVALAREGADVVICDVDGVPEGGWTSSPMTSRARTP